MIPENIRIPCAASSVGMLSVISVMFRVMTIVSFPAMRSMASRKRFGPIQHGPRRNNMASTSATPRLLASPVPTRINAEICTNGIRPS